MDNLKTKSLKIIEQRMENLDKSSLRYRILESAKNFKTSWIELGQNLYSVWKDKLYKEWGYNKFETYTAGEIGIRRQTAMKLLKSYYFLEKEEPAYITKDYAEGVNVALLPNYETIDVLRLARNKKTLDDKDYADLKKKIFEKGKDSKDLRRDLTNLMAHREELMPQEAWEKRKLSTVKRLLSTLKALKKEAEVLKLFPLSVINETDKLIKSIESQINT